jgi:mono/diheme cytochrome c family protein
MTKSAGFALSSLSALLALAALGAGPAAGQGKPDGKAIFLAQKCNTCHSVSTAGLERTTKSEKMAGPDLATVKVDPAFLTKYLRKQADRDGKKHGKTFTGSDQELATLIAWIQAQAKK